MGSVRRRLFLFLMVSLGPACLGSGGSNNKPPATIPSAPNSLVALTDSTSARIQLTWIDTADNEFEFRIERSDDGGITYNQVGTAPKNALGFTDLGLAAGTTYFYRVAAWNAKGYSTFAGPASRATKGLSWTAGSMANGPGIGKAWHSAIFDSSAGGKRMIVFGGVDDGLTILNEVWSYDLSAAAAGGWSLLTTSGTPPLPRFGHSAIYDPLNNRMIVFGGIAEVPPIPPSLVPQNDIHVLNLSTLAWSQPSVAGTPPGARAFHTAVYDSENERMLIYGGKDNGPSKLSDVFALSLSGGLAWSKPGTGLQPVGREQHSAIYAPLQSGMILFGGLDNETVLDGSVLAGDTWTLTLMGWTKLGFSTTPGLRMGHSAVYDAVNQRMVVFGGADSAAPTSTSGTWGLKLHTTPAWSLMAPTSGSPPPARYGHSAVYDSIRNRMVIYGGYDDGATAFDEVWVLDL